MGLWRKHANVIPITIMVITFNNDSSYFDMSVLIFAINLASSSEKSNVGMIKKVITQNTITNVKNNGKSTNAASAKNNIIDDL
jgi:hypothetical protein